MWKQKTKWNNSSTRQGITKKYYEAKIVQTETDSKCRLCQKYDETWEWIYYISTPHSDKRTIHMYIYTYIHTYRDKIVCVCVFARARAWTQLHFSKCKGIRIKLGNIHWYDHIQRLTETNHGIKQPYYGINKCKPTVLFITINRT